MRSLDRRICADEEFLCVLRAAAELRSAWTTEGVCPYTRQGLPS